MGCNSACRWVPPKFLHLAQSAIAWTIDWSRHGEWILSKRAILMRSRWKCPPFSCSILASSTVSSLVTHSHRATALVRVPPPTYQSFPSSTIYRAERCLALFLSLNPSPLCMPSSASTTSRNRGVVAKRSRKFCVVRVIEMQLIPYTRPAPDSQSASTSQPLPSSPAFGVFSYCQLIPSAMLVTPGMCRTSTMLWASTPSLHLACVAESLSFIRTSRRAWQSVSTSTGYP